MWKVLKKWKEMAREMRGNMVKVDVLEIKRHRFVLSNIFSEIY